MVTQNRGGEQKNDDERAMGGKSAYAAAYKALPGALNTFFKFQARNPAAGRMSTCWGASNGCPWWRSAPSAPRSPAMASSLTKTTRSSAGSTVNAPRSNSLWWSAHSASPFGSMSGPQTWTQGAPRSHRHGEWVQSQGLRVARDFGPLKSREPSGLSAHFCSSSVESVRRRLVACRGRRKAGAWPARASRCCAVRHRVR